jgi:hypothetical protein
MEPAWEAGLRNSEVFLCLVTKHYLRNAECWDQVALARQLHKPCIALIQKGTPVPPGFFDGFEDITYYWFNGEKDLKRISTQIAAKLGDVNIVDGGVD